MVDHDAVEIARGDWTAEETKRHAIERDIERLRSELGDAADLSTNETAEVMRMTQLKLAESQATERTVAKLRKKIEGDESSPRKASCGKN